MNIADVLNERLAGRHVSIEGREPKLVKSVDGFTDEVAHIVRFDDDSRSLIDPHVDFSVVAEPVSAPKPQTAFKSMSDIDLLALCIWSEARGGAGRGPNSGWSSGPKPIADRRLVWRNDTRRDP